MQARPASATRPTLPVPLWPWRLVRTYVTESGWLAVVKLRNDAAMGRVRSSALARPLRMRGPSVQATSLTWRVITSDDDVSVAGAIDVGPRERCC